MLSLLHFCVKKIKVFLKFFDLKWGGGRRKPERYHDCDYIYIDNKFENFFDQISIFFESGFFNPLKTVLVFKFYSNNYFNILAESKKYKIKICPYLFYRQLPDFNGRVIFYPYNSQSNARLILNRSATHVFLTHGESNKKASVNRMIRLYDYVLAAGDFSVDRYLESGVFTPYDIEQGRVIRIGDALIAKFGDYSIYNGEPALIYMPTWEGGLEEENFSSLSSPLVAKILINIVQSLNINSIVIRPHPNTGSRNTKYKNMIKNLCEFLLSRGIFVYMSEDSQRKIFPNNRLLKSVRTNTYDLCMVFGVVDISASEFMLAAQRIPSIVLAKNVNKCYASKSYFEARGGSFVDIDVINSNDDLGELFSLVKDIKANEVFFEKAFNRELFLKDKKPKEINNILLEYFKCNSNSGRDEF
ncbi:hypothetical protein [Comamonas kerstersii]|uniref:hypothetical protein n=1 Tax=Comamonas kerstersii TaxID=225992 RepID=UPI000B133024|nr:hypothetical protein [Comamonas kerstersii]